MERMSRRTFLVGAATGALVGAAGAGGAWAILRNRRRHHEPFLDVTFTGACQPDSHPAFAIPGRFPGRVVEIHGPNAIAGGEIQSKVVDAMVERGICQLTGASSAPDGWRVLFGKGDRVALKVNPVGATGPGKGSLSQFATVLAVVKGLQSAGVPLKDIVLFDRFLEDFQAAGYPSLVEKELPGVVWYAAAVRYDRLQMDLEGRDPVDGKRPDPNPRVLGYDPNVYAELEFIQDGADPKNPRSYRSYVTRLLTSGMVNKVINIGALKDHSYAGVTLTLKNLSHGMTNNVARTHAGHQPHQNRIATFIPKVVALPVFRKLVTLQMVDGLIGVFDGGPFGKKMWEAKSLFFATDPVAVDHVGWTVIDKKRSEEGLPSAANAGIPGTPHHRQPEHIRVASMLGLGLFEPSRIELRREVLPPRAG